MRSHKKALFICGTPFHVISSIILRYQLKMEADIIIYDAFSNTDLLINNLIEEKVFNDVRYLSRKKDFGLPQGESIIKRYFYVFGGYFRIKSLVESVIDNLGDYSDVFFANDQTTEAIDRFIFCYLKKYHTNINLHFMEDGLGSYHDEYYNLTNLDYTFRRLFVKGDSYILDMDIYLYSPRLFNLINNDSNRSIKNIYKPSSQVIEKLKRVFSYIKIEDTSQYDYIVFDTVREEEFNAIGIKKYNSLVEMIVGDKKAIVKPHPREKNKFFNYKYFETAGFPFEIMCLYCDFDNITFINNYSNAVFTAKLLFDKEPSIVFTYRKLQDYMHEKKNGKDIMVDNFKKLYKDSSKIIVLDE